MTCDRREHDGYRPSPLTFDPRSHFPPWLPPALGSWLLVGKGPVFVPTKSQEPRAKSQELEEHSDDMVDLAELRQTTTELFGPQLDRLQPLAIGMAVLGLVLTMVGWSMDGAGVFHSYLFGYLFWIGVTAGSLAFLMLHHVTGGGWGYVIRRFLEAATRLLPVMLILFVPVLIGLPSIYERWAGPHASQEILHAKGAYLNAPFFIARTVIYFAIWMILAYFLNLWGAMLDERPDRAAFNRLNLLGAVGIVLYVLTVTFAMVDWVMSLTPDWYSSIFGLLAVASQGLSALAVMLVLFAFLAGDLPVAREVPRGYFRDLGNLMLALVMLWAYMSFSQYLITYSGNTTEEVSWYVQRRMGGWGIVSVALIPLHFALPFMVLLVGSSIKRNPKWLARVAGFIILMRLVDLFWWVTPSFRPSLSVSAADLGTPLLIGGIWLWIWAGQVRGKTVVPLHDPRLEAALQEAVEHA
jgi:hypothetical protein